MLKTYCTMVCEVMTFVSYRTALTNSATMQILGYFHLRRLNAYGNANLRPRYGAAAKLLLLLLLLFLNNYLNAKSPWMTTTENTYYLALLFGVCLESFWQDLYVDGTLLLSYTVGGNVELDLVTDNHGGFSDHVT